MTALDTILGASMAVFALDGIIVPLFSGGTTVHEMMGIPRGDLLVFDNFIHYTESAFFALGWIGMVGKSLYDSVASRELVVRLYSERRGDG